MTARLFPISREEMIKAVEREVAMRKRVYPRWVSDRRLTQEKADHEIACMEAVLETLRGPDPLAPAPELAGTKPVVLYFGSDADRDEFVALVQEAKPGMVTRKL